jgi:hypothetical protein
MTMLSAAAVAGLVLCSNGSGVNAADIQKTMTTGQAGMPGQAMPIPGRPATAPPLPQGVLPPKGQVPGQPVQVPNPQPVQNMSPQPNRAGTIPSPAPGISAGPGQNTGQAPKSTNRPPVIAITGGGIDADIQGPLSETLRAMADKRLFEIRGPMPAGEEITVQFSGLTLDEALKKLMRGYNYVLMEQAGGQKPVLVLLGRIQRSAGSAQSPQPVQAVPVPVSQPASPSYAPQTPGAAGIQNRASNRRFPALNAAGGQPGGPEVPGVQEAGPMGQPGGQPGVAGAVQTIPGEGQAQRVPGEVGQQQPTPPQQGQAQQTMPQGQAQTGQSGASSRDLPNSQAPRNEANTGVKF